MKCSKAIIPIAGFGTRRLPITKSIEKSMLPILNRPVIDYVVEDCIKADITDIYFVISPGMQQVRSYYANNPALEEYLRHNNKSEMLDLITLPKGVNFHFVEQDVSTGAPYGTAIPVWLCREYLEPDEHFLVLMGDDFIYNPDGSSEVSRLVDAARKNGGAALLGVQVDPQEVSRYGVIVTEDAGDIKKFKYIQEKPAVSEAASNLINVSKYIFDYKFLEYLEQDIKTAQTEAEYYITDPINAYVAEGNLLQVLTAKGEYLDSGTTENWLYANQVVYQAQQKEGKHD